MFKMASMVAAATNFLKMDAQRKNCGAIIKHLLLIIFLFLIIQSIFSNNGVDGRTKSRTKLKNNSTETTQKPDDGRQEPGPGGNVSVKEQSKKPDNPELKKEIEDGIKPQQNEGEKTQADGQSSKGEEQTPEQGKGKPLSGEIAKGTDDKSKENFQHSNSEKNSPGNFMTYFIVIVIVVIILYLVLHNKKKLMAYIVEGRNTGRGRRQRATSGTEYKPLKTGDEESASVRESA